MYSHMFPISWRLYHYLNEDDECVDNTGNESVELVSQTAPVGF